MHFITYNQPVRLALLNPNIHYHEVVVPEYPLLHWRHLHEEIKKVSQKYYREENYYTAFLESAKRYICEVKKKSGETDNMADRNLMAKVFNSQKKLLDVVENFRKKDGTSFSNDTVLNIQDGQQFLSQGIITCVRNPLSHEELYELRESGLFTEKDCLDMLSLLSHLFYRLDNSVKKT